MTHEPDPLLLDGSQAIRDAEPVISLASPVLRELTNVGTLLFGKALESPKANQNAGFVISANYLHVLEMCDSIEILVSQSCGWTAVPLARSLFEALLAMDYVRERDSERRAVAWWVTFLHSAQDKIDRMDPRTAKGAGFLDRISQDKTLAGWGEPPYEAIERFRRGTAENLETHFSEEEAEYQRLVSTMRSRKPQWFAFHDGPKNLYELASHLNRGGQYDTIYRDWSEVVHAFNLTRHMKLGSGWPPLVTPLRDPKILGDVAFHSAGLTSEAIQCFADWFELPSTDWDLLDVDVKKMFAELRTVRV